MFVRAQCCHSTSLRWALLSNQCIDQSLLEICDSVRIASLPVEGMAEGALWVAEACQLATSI